MTKQSAASGSSALSTGKSSWFRNSGRSLIRFVGNLRSGLVRSNGVLTLLAAIASLGVSSVTAQAQYSLATTWSQQSPVNSPAARNAPAMANDTAHGQVVLFGGDAVGVGTANDTWLWNGTNWTQAVVANSPPARSDAAMAYDSAHGQVVMFGGLAPNSGTQRFGDTWLWNGTTWTQASPANSPPARDGQSMVYDPVHGQVVMFGGIDDNSNVLSDTWLWNGTTWTQASGEGPSARFGTNMAYDAATSSVLLFGGEYSADLADTWTWNGSSWTQQSPTTSPSARESSGIAYDAALGQVVLFGGNAGGTDANDTWLWNGTTWTQYTSSASPSARELTENMVYDSARGQVLLFGGANFVTNNNALGDTWEFGLPGNFGNVNVCPAGATIPSPCSKTLSFTVNVSSFQTLGTPQVLTQGISGLDFTLSSGTTCNGVGTTGSCVVNATFTPIAPGLRTGAVQLMYPGTGIALSIPVYGVGRGPAATVAPGSGTTLASGLNTPYGAAVDAGGDVFFTDSGAGTVTEVAPNGTTTTLGPRFSRPTGVAVDGAGNLFIADSVAGAVVEIPYGCASTSCEVSLAASTGVGGPSGVAVDGAGDIFFTSFTSNSSIAQAAEIPVGCTAPTCAKVLFTGPTGQSTPSQPDGIALDAAGDVFIADGGGPHNVTKIPAGCASASCQVTVGTGFQAPTAVAVDAAGDVFVADANFGVSEVPAGCTSFSCQSVVDSGGAPFGVAIDAQGDVIVPLSGAKQVVEVNRSQTGTLNFPTTTLGTTSTASATLQNVGNQVLQPESPGLLTVSGASYSNTTGPGTPPDCSGTATLAAGAECNVSILFSPQSNTQPNTGTAVFHDNSLNAPSVFQAVYLFGMGAKPVQTFYQVTVTEPGSGSGTVFDASQAIECTETNGTSAGTCTANLPGLGAIPFTATASGNSTFQGWGGACASAGTNPVCSIVLTAATSITATFVNPVNYPLTVTASGTGTGTVTDTLGQISCSQPYGVGNTCSGNYPGGTLVTLTATPFGNSVFAGWGGACSSSGASPLCIVTMNSALNVNASFVTPPATQAATLKPITAGIVYGQGGSFTTGTANNGGVSANSLNFSQGMFVDGGGNLYLSDGNNNRVLFYPAGSTTATRVYGQNGSLTSNASNNGGLSANSLFNPQGIAVDSNGNVYISDEYNSRVLFYPAGSTTATRVYGQNGSFTTGGTTNGTVSANSLFIPIGIALDSGGNLYVADYGNSRVLFYPAGSTTATRVYGQGGSFTSNTPNNGGISANSLNQAQAVALDSSGDLYVADIYNNRVLFYPANSTTATQVYGQGGSFTSGTANNGGVNANTLNNPLALSVDSNGGLYVVDRSNNRVLFYPFGSATAARVYGQGNSFNAAALNNGGISANSLNQPWSVTTDPSGNLYVADYGNNRVLEYGSFGNINVCPANQGAPAPCNSTVTFSYAPAATTTIGAATVVTQGVTGLDFSLGTGTACTGTIVEGTSCTINVNFAPLVPGLRTGAVELFDNTGKSAATAPIYGIGKASQIAFGPATQSTVNTGTLSTPKGVLADGVGNLFVSDTTLQQVIKIASNGTRTTVGVGLQFPQGMAEDGAGNLYIADNNLNAIVEVPAGCTSSTCQQLLGTNLRSQLGVAVDGAGDVFIGDFLDGEVVKNPPGCTTSACQTVVYSPDGGSNPVGITVDSAGNLYVADFGLRQVVEVPAGCANASCQLRIGSGWSQPDGVAADAAGDVFIADAGLDEIVEAPAGCTAAACLSVVASGFNTVAVTVDAVGDLFFEDFVNARVLEQNRSQLPSLSFAQTNVGSTSISPSSVSLQNIGNQPLTGSLALNLGGNFTQTNPLDCAAQLPLAPGLSCGETFNFTPQSATFLSGTAVFTDNNLNLYPATQSISLSGIGAINNIAGTVAVPNVVGQAQTAVATPISAVGLAMGTVSTASSSTVPSGTIISQNPVAGTQVAVGSAVNLLVSSGIAQPVSPNPLSLNNNYFLTGDYVSAGVTLRGKGAGGMATGNITIPTYASSATQGVPDGADIIDAFLYWETLENTPLASSTSGVFNKYPIVGQQIGNDIPNYVDGTFTGTIRAYRANVNIYLPVAANGIRYAEGTYSVSLPDGATALPLTEGASLVLVYRVLSKDFPLKSVVIYDGAGAPAVTGAQVVQGFYDAVGGAGTGKNTNLFAAGGAWNSSANPVTLGPSSQYSVTLNPGAAYAAVILSTPVNNSDNDGILDAWKTGPATGDFHAGQPGYYDVKTGMWVGLPGAKHGQKDLFVQLDYMCAKVQADGTCDPTQENLFPAPDTSGNDPLAMVQQAFVNSGVQLHLQIGNAVPESTCIDGNSAQLCQFPNQPGVIGWKNSLEFSKLYPRNLAACLSGGDCTTRFPFGQKDSYHYVLMGHSLAIPAFNTRFGTLTSISVVTGVTTIVTADRGNASNQCPGRITIGGVLGNPSLNGVYNTMSCPDTKTIIVATPGVPNWSYPNNNLPEPVIGLTSGTITSISGYSDLGGADSAVTLGLWLTAPNQDMSKKANVLAGTIFHEIGHTLGLGHGGLYYDGLPSYVPTFEGNCKPNYQSVMNYLFQLDLVGPNQTLAFSNQALTTVNETSAGSVTQLVDATSSAAATFPTSAWYVPYTIGSPVSPATRHCDGTPLLPGDSSYRVDAPIAPITPAWSSPQDLSFTGLLGTPQTSERGFNDLANMDLRQVGATGGEFASLASVLSFGSSPTPLNISAGGTVALGSGGTVSLAAGGTVALGSGGTVTLGSGGTVTLGSGGTVALGSGGTVSLPFGGTVAPGSSGTVTLGSGGTVALGSGGTVTLGSGGTVTLGSGGTVTLGSGGVIALGSGGTVTIPSTGGSYTLNGSGGVVTLGSGGTVALGSGGTVTLGSGGTVALGSGGTVALGSGGVVTLGSGGIVTLGSGGVVALGSGGTVTLGSGGTVALGSGGTVTLGSGGTVTLGSGGTVTLGSGGVVALGSGGTVTLGSGGTATLGAGGTVTLGSGGTVTVGAGTVTLGGGGTVTLGSGGTVTLGSGGLVTLGSGGTLTVGGTTVPVGPGLVNVAAGGVVTLGSGGVVALGSGGTVALGSGGVVALGSGGVVTLGSGGTVTLGSGGVVALGSGGSVSLGSGSDIALASTSNITPASGGPQAANELTYETANSVVRPPTAPTETPLPGAVRITWKAPAFGVVQTYTIYRSSNGATPIVIGSVSGVNGNPPATEFTDTNPDLTPHAAVVYTITTTLVPDTTGPSRQSTFSPPAVLKNDQSITLGPLPSSVTLGTPTTVTATAMSGGTPNGLLVAFSAAGSCAIGTPSIAINVSYATVTLNTTGSCIVTASQPGTTTFNAANSVSGTFMVLPQGSSTKSQTITFPPLPNVQYGGTFSLSASSNASPSIPVTFTASGPCATNGSISGVGVCKITASAPASGGYSAASLTQSFNIYPAVLKVTATSLTSPYGQPLPALLYSYSGYVNGDAASMVPVVSGAPSLSTTATATSNAGSYPITVSTGTLATANYSFLYVSGTLTVQPANQAALTLITTSPLTYGQSENLGVAGGTTSGALTYAVTGPCTLSLARLTATSGTGSCQVTATMAGTNNYNSVTSTPANKVMLSLASQTITFTTNPPTSAAYTSTFTVAATGGASANPVIFTSAGACSNSGATYTVTNSAGTCSVIANQAGNTNYAAATQVTKNVSATGPSVSVSTSNINFGTVFLGSISAQTITLTNVGTAAVTINDPILSIVKGGNSNEFVALSLCPKPLAAGKSCTVTIGFLAGPFYTPQTATLQIVSNAPGSPQPVTLSATVINPQAHFSSTSLSFGTIKHATSSTMNVTLSNPGGTPLTLKGISVTGANATSFGQTSNCGSSLAAGANCTIAVKFTPATAGKFSADLTVVDNAQSGSGTQTVPLSGTGN